MREAEQAAIDLAWAYQPTEEGDRLLQDHVNAHVELLLASAGGDQAPASHPVHHLRAAAPPGGPTLNRAARRALRKGGRSRGR